MKALLLDLGGVVIDVDPRRCFDHWASTADAAPTALAARWEADQTYEAFEVGAIDFAQYIDGLSRRLRITLDEADWRDGWNALLGEAIEGVVELLPTLAARVPLYCFSNTNVVHQACFEQRFGDALAPFRRIFASWKLGLRKPDAEAYHRVANLIGVAPEEILFLDDNADNVAGAATAGLDARHVRSAADTLAVLREHGLI